MILSKINIYGKEKKVDLQFSSVTQSCCSPRDPQESSLTPQFKSINASVLSFLYSPSLKDMTFNEELTSILVKLFQKTEEERTHVDSFYEILIPKPEKDTTGKGNYTLIGC